MYFTIIVGVKKNDEGVTFGDAYFSAPEGRINILIADEDMEIIFDSKPLIEAIRRSLLDELDLL